MSEKKVFSNNTKWKLYHRPAEYIYFHLYYFYSDFTTAEENDMKRN